MRCSAVTNKAAGAAAPAAPDSGPPFEAPIRPHAPGPPVSSRSQASLLLLGWSVLLLLIIVKIQLMTRQQPGQCPDNSRQKDMPSVGSSANGNHMASTAASNC